MKKSKTLFVFSALISISLLVTLTLTSCFTVASTVARQVSKGKISEELIIQPDPDNPFQGTWIDPTKNSLHVIDGMNGALYILGVVSYNKNAVYVIEENDNGFETSNHWRISVKNNILTVENTTYERYVK